MAYYNGFPATYQNYQYQMPGQQVNTGIIWVQGEAGAKSYLVAPNTTVQLWDSETQRIFLKSADASGMPSMKILEYTIQGDSGAPAAISQNMSMDAQYATKSAVEELRGEIDALRSEIEKVSARRRRTREDVDNE